MSDKAAACVGCGAPLPRTSTWQRTGFNPEPEHAHSAAPGRRQLLYRAAASLAALVLGLVGSSVFDRRTGAAHTLSTLAAVLVVIGVCGVIVTGIQLLVRRR